MGTDKLFDLISRMTRSEKRYFTINAKKFTEKTNNYLKLFNALNEMAEYDEEKLLKKSKKGKFIKNLNSEKNYLYDALLDSLRSFNKKKSPKAQVRELLLDADFLRSRGLYQQCNKVLQKAKKLAQHNEFYLSLLEINRIERLLSRYVLKRNIAGKIKELDEEWWMINDLIKEDYKYFNFHNQCLYVLNFDQEKKDPEQISKFEEVYADTLKLDPKSINSKRINFFRFMSIITYYRLKRDDVNRNDYYAKTFAWIEENQEIKKIMVKEYRVFLINYLNVFIKSNDWSEFPKVANEIKNLPQNDIHQEGLTTFSIIYYELIYFMNICDFTKAKELADESEKLLEKYQGTITISTELGFKVNIAILYFILEDFGESLKFINAIILSSEKENRKDILRSGRMFEVILHYELNSIDIFESIFRSSLRYFKNHEVEYEFELLVLDYVNRLQRSVDADKIEIFIKMKESLENMRRKEGGENIVGLEEILMWVKSRISRQPIIKILQDQIKK